MEPIGAVLVASGGVLITAATFVAARALRHAVPDAPVRRIEQPSPLRVLRSEDELRDAISRAVAFERDVAATLRVRAERYEALASKPVIDALAARRAQPALGDADAQPHSA